MMCTPGHREECWHADPTSKCVCNCGGVNHGIARKRDDQGDVFDMPELRLDKMTTFVTIEDFYATYPEARHSGESDYGVWWRDDDGGVWRVSYVHATGHVYAIRAGSGVRSRMIRVGGQEIGAAFSVEHDGPVVILGKLEARPEIDTRWRGRGEDPAERVLTGWADVCGQQGSLAWVAHRIQGASR